jgi:hypothetical protein
MKREHTKLSIIFLILITALIHLPVVIKWGITENLEYSRGKSFDDYHNILGDRTFYLAGAISLYEFDIIKKFNDKPQPIIHPARPIASSDMPWYAKYVLVAYPNPSFKFGYSVIVAALSGLFPSRLFDHIIPRLTFVNLILLFACLPLIYLILKHFIGSTVGALFGCSFFIFDAWLAYNSYLYQSHTIAGIFLVLLAYYITFKKTSVKARDILLVFFFLTLSVFTSSHVIPVAAVMGVLIFIFSCLGQGKAKITKYFLAGIIGTSIIPSYILGVEYFFEFKRLGLPPLFAQLRQYSEVVKSIIEQFPLHIRFIYDIRLYNIFAIPILIMFLYILFRQIQVKLKADKNEEMPERKVFLKKRLWLVLFLSTLIGLAITAGHNVPVTRSEVTYTVFIGILIGAWFGKRFVLGTKDVKFFCIIILGLLFANFYLINEKNSLPLWGAPGCKIWANTPDVLAMSLSQFVQKYGSLSTSQRENCYVTFDGMDLVRPYAADRRFWKEFVQNEENLVTPQTFKTDFRLMSEIMALQEPDFITKGDFKRLPKMIWDIRLWDQEIFYFYGYLNRVQEFTKGTPLESINPRYFYYFRFRPLEEALLKNNPIFSERTIVSRTKEEARSTVEKQINEEFDIKKHKTLSITNEQITVSTVNSAGENKENMIDGNPNTYWHVKNPKTANEEWVQLDLKQIKNVKYLAILSRKGLNQLWTWDNAMWEGSNDSRNWKFIARLDMRKNQSDKSGRIAFALPDAGPYRYFRLRVNDPSFFSIAELQLYEN